MSSQIYLKYSKSIPRITDKIRIKFWKHVLLPSINPKICWEWQGQRHDKGYGVFDINGKSYLAHRISLAIHGRKLIKGLTVDHLCRNRLCVNPHHLEQVTNKENILRGIGTSATHARKTECKYGHLLSGDNLYFDGKKRHCKICWRNRAKKQYDKKVGKI